MLPLNLLLMKLRRRAEANDPAMLVETFVDVGPLFARLSTPDHQILAGRRGTGKTHAQYYLAASVLERGDLGIFVDMRRLGSTGGLYADNQIPITERGTRLLCDTLEHIHDALVDATLAMHEEHDQTAALSVLDRLADEIARVVVVGGTTDAERTTTEEARTEDGGQLSLGMSPSGPVVTAGLDSRSTRGQSTAETLRHVGGVATHRVHFGAVTRLIEQLLDALPVDRVWILLDEWSDVPMELQPLLADLVRRALFPVHGVTVKIGAIEHRSNFREVVESGGHLGIEVGADAAADLDLDDFMVFGNDAEKAKEFFRELLYRHVRAVMSVEVV